VVSITLLWLVVNVLRMKAGRLGFLAPALLLVVLLLTQVTLGALTVLLRKPADIASAHVAVGALLLMTTFVLAMRSFRLYAFRRPAVVRGGFEPVMRRNDLTPSPMYSGKRVGVRG
jgi:heme A synthase